MMQNSLQPRAYKAFTPGLLEGMVTLVPAQKESSSERYDYDVNSTIYVENDPDNPLAVKFNEKYLPKIRKECF